MAQRKAAAVSMEESLKDAATERAHALGFSTFSAYVVQLIRKDLLARGELTLKETPAAPPASPGHTPAVQPPAQPKKRQSKKKP